jgi:hypothetical protein
MIFLFGGVHHYQRSRCHVDAVTGKAQCAQGPDKVIEANNATTAINTLYNHRYLLVPKS